MFSTRRVSEQDRQHEQPDGDTQHGIGQIERVPVPSGPIDHIDEVADSTVVEGTIPEVAADARREQPHGHLNEPLPRGAEQEQPQDDRQGDRRHAHKEQPIAGGDAEGRPIVERQPEREDAVEDRLALIGPVAQGREHRVLGPQVQQNPHDGRRPEDQVSNAVRQGLFAAAQQAPARRRHLARLFLGCRHRFSHPVLA